MALPMPNIQVPVFVGYVPMFCHLGISWWCPRVRRFLLDLCVMSIPAGDREVMVPAWDGETANHGWNSQPIAKHLWVRLPWPFLFFLIWRWSHIFPIDPIVFGCTNPKKSPSPQRRIAQVHDTGHVALHFINLRPCHHVPVSGDD